MKSVYFITVAVCLHAVTFADALNMRSNLSNAGQASPFDFRKTFDPPEMLIVSSPMERKVSFTQIKDFKSIGSVVLPIIDAGVIAPYGIAWDARRSALYVCDGAARKIFRVNIKAVDCLGADCKGMPYKLAAYGNMDTVVANTLTQWVTVDDEGNIYYSDQETHSVDKLRKIHIDMIIEGRLNPLDMGKTTEPEAAGEESADERMEENSNLTEVAGPITQTTTPPPKILQLYQASESPNVGTPAGLAASGPQLFWTNQVGGLSSGSVSYGKTNPRAKIPAEGDDKPSFPSSKLANNTASSYGLAVTRDKVVYTDTHAYIWAASRGTGEVVPLTKSMLKPRGLVWDGDNTVYVADEEANFVGSLPVGVLHAKAPVTHTLDIHSPFGVAFIGKQDPVWDALRLQYGGANRVANIGMLVMVVASMAAALRL